MLLCFSLASGKIMYLPFINEMDATQLQEIISTFNPSDQTVCTPLQGGADIDLYESTAGTLVFHNPSGANFRIEIRYIDDSFVFNQMSNGKKFVLLPPYRPVQWIKLLDLQAGSNIKVCRYSGETRAAGQVPAATCSAQCAVSGMSANNTALVKYPRPLNKPTHEFFLTAEIVPAADDVTMTTMCTYDRLPRLKQMAQAWGGPISAALYLEDLQTELPIVMKFWLANEAMRRHMDIHVVYDDKINDINWPDRPFPVNYLRNVGIRYARTQFVIFVEADFIPNINMYSSLEGVRKRIASDPHSVFIVPSFYSEDKTLCSPDFDMRNFPKSKQEVMAPEPNRGAAGPSFGIHPMSKLFSSHTRIPYDEWFKAGPDNYIQIDNLAGNEPYYIGSRDFPLFDEVFIGCMQDKIEHVHELERRGYKFFLAPEAFITHLDSTGMGSAWCRNIDGARGTLKWDMFTKRLAHEMSNPKTYIRESSWWDLNPAHVDAKTGGSSELQEVQSKLRKALEDTAKSEAAQHAAEGDADESRRQVAVLKAELSLSAQLLRESELRVSQLQQSFLFVMVASLVGGGAWYFVRSRRRRKSANPEEGSIFHHD
eukprot:TRINITY_DN26577_c0_g1_i1.p1 TRINITY_DN26577_c0_g1~~TRINITY_DN26577_c0_g1_i1.p1  ORF type:complete len:611 (+),score=122.38 TRINITY_DN26577_c0_g1_i1:46-1833(+)